ncbi:MAG TPA: hypothetical protein VMU17_00100 [Elusimicrobiota bacterium]|nr:hypothetical protein [Elusimicrobiota bacterium]
MRTFLHRCFAVALIPALVFQPAWGLARIGFPAQNHPVSSPFEQEAIVQSLLSAERGAARRLSDHPTIGKLARVSGVVAATAGAATIVVDQLQRHWNWIGHHPIHAAAAALTIGGTGIFGTVIQHLAGSDDQREVDAFDYVRRQRINFDPRFYERANALSLKDPKSWTPADWTDYRDLRAECEKAADWMQGWLRKSKYYKSLKGHTVTLLSLEAIINNGGEGLESYAGGLGVLFGEWIRAIAYLGGVTTLEPKSEAPEFQIFVPDYKWGRGISQVGPFGYPELGVTRAKRPQDYAIEFYKAPGAQEPLEVAVPVNNVTGPAQRPPVYVRFRLVPVAGIQIIMPTTDFEKNDAIFPENRSVLNQLYGPPPNTLARFEQEWVTGLAAYEFKRQLGLPIDGPVHLNETATFSYLIGLLRGYMEDGYSYEEALRMIGSQTIFVTHTLVAAGIDQFMDGDTPIGHYIRMYFEKSDVPAVRRQAEMAARHLIGKDWINREEEVRFEKLPRFWDPPTQKLSPLRFIIELLYASGGHVAAVSRLNAEKAGTFLTDLKILTREALRRKPVRPFTNGVDLQFWLNPKLVKLMRLDQAGAEDQRPEYILEPQDPNAMTLAADHGRADIYQAAQSEPGRLGINDVDFFNLLQSDKQSAIAMTRRFVRHQQIRITHELEDLLKVNTADVHVWNRLHFLRVRWARWNGQPDPEQWVKSWERLPADQQAPFRQELYAGDLQNLLDPESFLVVWGRRTVPYKRLLFTLAGRRLPILEWALREVNKEKAPTPDQMRDIFNHLLTIDHSDQNPYGVFQHFVDSIRRKNIQFVFSGLAFGEDGKADVAFLHYAIDRLQEMAPGIADRAIFLEGYDVEKSRALARGLNGHSNTPKRPEEASGTSGMKVAEAVLAATGDGWISALWESVTGRVRDLSGKPYPAEHPDHWPAEVKRQHPEWVEAYFLDEEEFYFGALAEMSAMYHQAQSELAAGGGPRLTLWMRLIRDGLYQRAASFDVRRQFTGGVVPSYDPLIPGGREDGFLDVYAESVDQLTAARDAILAAHKKQKLTIRSFTMLYRMLELADEPAELERWLRREVLGNKVPNEAVLGHEGIRYILAAVAVLSPDLFSRLEAELRALDDSHYDWLLHQGNDLPVRFIVQLMTETERGGGAFAVTRAARIAIAKILNRMQSEGVARLTTGSDIGFNGSEVYFINAAPSLIIPLVLDENSDKDFGRKVVTVLGAGEFGKRNLNVLAGGHLDGPIGDLNLSIYDRGRQQAYENISVEFMRSEGWNLVVDKSPGFQILEVQMNRVKLPPRMLEGQRASAFGMLRYAVAFPAVMTVIAKALMAIGLTPHDMPGALTFTLTALVGLPSLMSLFIWTRLPSSRIAATRAGDTTYGEGYLNLDLLAQAYVDMEEAVHRLTTRRLDILNQEANWRRPFSAIGITFARQVDELIAVSVALATFLPATVIELWRTRRLQQPWLSDRGAYRQKIISHLLHPFKPNDFLPNTTPLAHAVRSSLKPALRELHIAVRRHDIPMLHDALSTFHDSQALSMDVRQFNQGRTWTGILDPTIRRQLSRWLLVDWRVEAWNGELLAELFPDLPGLSIQQLPKDRGAGGLHPWFSAHRPTSGTDRAVIRRPGSTSHSSIVRLLAAA